MVRGRPLHHGQRVGRLRCSRFREEIQADFVAKLNRAALREASRIAASTVALGEFVAGSCANCSRLYVSGVADRVAWLRADRKAARFADLTGSGAAANNWPFARAGRGRRAAPASSPANEVLRGWGDFRNGVADQHAVSWEARQNGPKRRNQRRGTGRLASGCASGSRHPNPGSPRHSTSHARCGAESRAALLNPP